MIYILKFGLPILIFIIPTISCMASSNSQTSDKILIAGQLNSLEYPVEIPADWFLIINDAYDRLKKENLDIFCHTIYLDSSSINRKEDMEYSNEEYIFEDDKLIYENKKMNFIYHFC